MHCRVPYAADTQCTGTGFDAKSNSQQYKKHSSQSSFGRMRKSNPRGNPGAHVQ